ncbi:MAG TPA: S9 family peptidase, partial [Candidatus Polarisedimenticolaceae bacterium]|nr:S9 family peptidase [Candidatus Polarisedimenticolaceae bacterium]
MPIKPPVAKRTEHVEVRHGGRVADPYAWLRDDSREDPEVLAYLEAENAYTEAMMRPVESLRRRLYDEMVARIKEDDSTVPVRKDDYFYYSRTERGKQYRIHCRRRGGLDAAEQVVLDENQLAEGHDYLRVGAFAVSPDHRLLAFSTDFDGSERFTLRVKDLDSGRLLPDSIDETYYSVEWAGDSRTLFYTRIDRTHRPFRLFRHRLGQPAADDRLVYEESDPAFYLGLRKTKDDRFLVLSLESAVTSEERFLDAGDADGLFRLIEPRRNRHEYAAEHWNGRFLILTNDDAVNFKLVETPVETPSREHWRTMIDHRDEVKLDAIEVFRDRIAVLKRERGLREIDVIDRLSAETRRIEFSEPAYDVYFSGNAEFDTDTLRFEYESMTTPRSTYDYEMPTGERTLLKRIEVLGGFDPERYVAERLFADSVGGKQVPISLVYRKGALDDGPAPLLLYGYGAYGATIDPGFSSARVSLLDRGMVYAIANVRGGGALGRPWYEDGKLLAKRNTFDDFIAAAEQLIGRGYTASDRLAIAGGSAGGLLVGAALNMRPELFRAAVAKVPFVDVVNTMLDPTIPLT